MRPARYYAYPFPLVKPLPWQATGQNKLIESITFILLKMSLKTEIFFGFFAKIILACFLRLSPG